QKGQEVDVHKSIDNISIHKIRRGDSLWRLARRYHTSVGNLKRWNQLRGSKIYPGQSLIVELRR
ncbi:MAG: LysM peptidoglycan-binding domain-containing protein, partial [bacterium]